jgi:hypothetical protein
MSEQTANTQRYAVSVYEPDEAGGALVFTFVPKGTEQDRGPNGAPRRVPQFIVAARQQGDGITFDWSDTLDDPNSAKG